MAFTRKMLKAMGIDDEKVDEIIEAHTEVTNSLKEQAKENKEAAEKLKGVQKELDELKAKGDDGYKAKYEAEKEAFEQYKAEVEGAKEQESKEKAYREMLKDVLSEKGVEKAVKYADWSKIEIDEKGKLKNASDHVKAVKEEWAEHVSITETRKEDPANPPDVKSSAKTKADIYKKDEAGRYILSTEERQKALLANQIR